MLYYDNKKWTKSFDVLLSSKGLTIYDDDKKEIKKLLNKGIDVYTNYDPYAMEIDHEMVLVWNIDKDALEHDLDQSAEDI